MPRLSNCAFALLACYALAACQPGGQEIDPSRVDFAPDSASGGQPLYAGGDGTSQEKAVVMAKGLSDIAATSAEYKWLKQHRPGWEVVQQALVGGKRSYDVLTVGKAGRTDQVWFDITDTLGVHF